MTAPINQKVSTFTPVDGANWFVKQSALYLSPLSGVKQIAVHTISTDAADSDKRLCASQDYETTCLATLMKVVTYIATAGILVLAAFIVTYAYRCFNDFHYLPENSGQTQNPPSSTADAAGEPEGVPSGSTTQQSLSDSSGEGLLSCEGMPPREGDHFHDLPETQGEDGTPSSAQQQSPSSAPTEETLEPASVNNENPPSAEGLPANAQQGDVVDPLIPPLEPVQPEVEESAQIPDGNAVSITANKTSDWANFLLAASKAEHFAGVVVPGDSDDDVSPVSSPRSLGQPHSLIIDELSEANTTPEISPMHSPLSLSPQASDSDHELSAEALAAFQALISAGSQKQHQSSLPASPASSAPSSPKSSAASSDASQIQAQRDRDLHKIDMLWADLPNESSPLASPASSPRPSPKPLPTPLNWEEVLAGAISSSEVFEARGPVDARVEQSDNLPPLQALGELESNNDSSASDSTWGGTISAFLGSTEPRHGTTQDRVDTLSPSEEDPNRPVLVSVDASPFYLASRPVHKDKTLAEVHATIPSRWGQFKNNVNRKLGRQAAKFSFTDGLWR